ncbi:MAG: methionine--tRNA ligase [Nanoarchaeota archaeon]|nr:methionine--tRNA ligase [Nanoarchaeota archaeon]
MAEKFYITTAIDYVNAKPHIGHAFEKVLADAIARFNSQKGKDVFFLTGVDENAQKNVEAAIKEGVDVKEFVDKNANLFIDLCEKLNIKYDKFVRTTAEEHKTVVQEIINKIIENGDVYEGDYEGDYCTGCELYLTNRDLIDGKCKEHDRVPEHRKEKAHFFKLSKYREQLIELIEDYVVPKQKKNEILSRLNEDLKDLCITRSGLDWGIDFPKDNNFKVYVWVDALINYISGAPNEWPADLHVIGKGINWFHSVIWPAILLSAGYELPKKLLVHGYLTIDGKKISKSIGNTIDPKELVEKYGCDAVRFSLLRCSVFDDSDYSEEILIERYNNELANKLGNLVSRVSTLAEKYGIEETENNLIKKLNEKSINKHFEEFRIDKALNEIFAFIDLCNEYIQEKKPWETKDKKVLFELVEALKKISVLLGPFIPDSAEKIAEIFKTNNIKKSDIIFKKIEEQ